MEIESKNHLARSIERQRRRPGACRLKPIFNVQARSSFFARGSPGLHSCPSLLIAKQYHGNTLIGWDILLESSMRGHDRRIRPARFILPVNNTVFSTQHRWKRAEWSSGLERKGGFFVIGWSAGNQAVNLNNAPLH